MSTYVFDGRCRSKTSLRELVPGVDNEALHLLTHLLHFNPDKRLSAEQALRHPFVKRSVPPRTTLELHCVDSLSAVPGVWLLH